VAQSCRRACYMLYASPVVRHSTIGLLKFHIILLHARCHRCLYAGAAIYIVYGVRHSNENTPSLSHRRQHHHRHRNRDDIVPEEQHIRIPVAGEWNVTFDAAPPSTPSAIGRSNVGVQRSRDVTATALHVWFETRVFYILQPQSARLA